MEDNAIYSQLRNLYSKDTSLDSLSKGVAIEEIVRKLLQDIMPFSDLRDANFFNRRFDGFIPLGRGKGILFEIKLGYLQDFDLQKLRKIFYDLGLIKPLFLLIAYGLGNSSEAVLNKVREENLPISFIDFENLIELHKFVKSNITASSSGTLRIKKRYFLEELLKRGAILDRSAFNTANLEATDRFEEHSETKKPAYFETAMGVEMTSKREYYYERLEKLESLARDLLNEVQAFRKQLEKEKS